MYTNDPAEAEADHPRGPVPLITLSELRSLGQFARCQDLERLLAKADPNRTLGYPLFNTRLTPNKYIDLLLKGKWETVEFIRVDDSHIYYRRGDREEKLPLDDPWATDSRVGKYCIAPARLFTAYDGDMSTINSATLSNEYQRSSGSVVTRCEVQTVSPPYITFRVEYADGRGSSGWEFEMFHIADPRIHVNGVVPHRPFYNSPIAVSHRWLSESHPDPGGTHFRELLRLCEDMALLDCQTFFIDYCSLPQPPRTVEEDVVFRRQLMEANRLYQKSTVILVQHTDDYETRAWCMFEMILSSVRNAILNKDAVNGKLKEAFDLAHSFIEVKVEDFEAKKKEGIMPGRTISPQQFSKWASGSLGLNRVYHDMQHRNKDSLLNWFHEHGLKSSNVQDIPCIVELLDEFL